MGRVGIDVVVAVLSALVAAVLSLDRADLWNPTPAVVVALVALTALLATAAAVLHAADSARARRRDAHRDLLEDLLQGALWAVADSTGLDARDLSTAAYEVRRSPLHPRRAPRLLRLHRVRAARRPAASGTTWTPGKGVIGACVAQGRVVAADLAHDEAALAGLDATAFEALPPAARWGLTHAEFERVRGRCPVVVAVPVLDDTGPASRVVGCLALDGPAGSLPHLDAPAVLGVLEATARAVTHLGGPTARAAALRERPAAADPGEQLLAASLGRLGVPPRRPPTSTR